MDLASVVAALASVGVRVSGSTPNNNIQGDSSRACPTGLAGPEPSGTHNDPGQHFQMRGTTGTPRLRNPLRWSYPRHRCLRPFLILHRRRLRRPWARHPVHPVVGVSFLSPSTHPTIASTIRTLVRNRGGRGGGKNTTNTPTPKNLHRGGESPKSRRNVLFPSGGRRLRAKNTPRSLRPRGPMKRRTPLRWGTLIPSRKMFSLPLGNLRTRPLILRIRVQSLQ